MNNRAEPYEETFISTFSFALGHKLGSSHANNTPDAAPDIHETPRMGGASSVQRSPKDTVTADLFAQAGGTGAMIEFKRQLKGCRRELRDKSEKVKIVEGFQGAEAETSARAHWLAFGRSADGGGDPERAPSFDPRIDYGFFPYRYIRSYESAVQQALDLGDYIDGLVDPAVELIGVPVGELHAYAKKLASELKDSDGADVVGLMVWLDPAGAVRLLPFRSFAHLAEVLEARAWAFWERKQSTLRSPGTVNARIRRRLSDMQLWQASGLSGPEGLPATGTAPTDPRKPHGPKQKP